jgi:hypothetical protein
MTQYHVLTSEGRQRYTKTPKKCIGKKKIFFLGCHRVLGTFGNKSLRGFMNSLQITYICSIPSDHLSDGINYPQEQLAEGTI